MGGAALRRDSAPCERPREEWIEIPVPAIIDEPTFARAQELLHENKVHARRRTIEPSLVQGLVSCRKCDYAFSRISTRSSARRIQYYRCIGSDRWRHVGGPRCDTRPVRQDLLDEVVWTEVLRLLEEPALIQRELDRRLAAAQAADPTRTRTQAVERDRARVGKTIERLLTAYQEDLVSLEQLRERMPLLRQREQTLRHELNALVEQTRDRAAHLRLAETLSAFLTRLRSAAQTLDILERQRIVRLLVKEVLVSDDTIVIRHCIPVPSGPPPTGSGPNGHAAEVTDRPNYLLRSGSNCAQPGDPGYGPVLSLTRQQDGKTITRIIPAPAEAETRARIAEHRRFRQLSKALVEVSTALCEARLAAGCEPTAEAVKKGLQGSFRSRGRSGNRRTRSTGRGRRAGFRGVRASDPPQGTTTQRGRWSAG